MVQEAVEDGGGRRHVADELAPVLDRAVRGHQRRAVLVTAHDDLEKVLARPIGQGLDSHVVDQQQIRLQIPGQDAFLAAQRFVPHEVPDQVEDGAVEDEAAGLDDLVADGLADVAFPDTWRPDQQDVLALAHELAGGQLVDRLALDGGVEAPVEVVQGLPLAKAGGLEPARDQALASDVEFILEDEFQEFLGREGIAAGFLQAHVH